MKLTLTTEPVDPQTITQYMPVNRMFRAVVTGANGYTYNTRIMNEKDSLFIFRRGSRKYGHRTDGFKLSTYHYRQIVVTIPSVVDEATRWRDQWQRVHDKLGRSDLWPDLRHSIHNGLIIGYDLIQKANELDLNGYKDEELSYEERERKQKESIKALHPLFKELSTSDMWRMRPSPRIKSMYFGRFNASTKAAIKEALQTKQAYDTHERGSKDNKLSYDVSFEYHPDKNKAFYSEEYRGCGNGHYYIAINASQALFMEDD